MIELHDRVSGVAQQCNGAHRHRDLVRVATVIGVDLDVGVS